MQMKDTQPGTLIQLPVGKVSIQKKFISKRNRVFLCSIRGKINAEHAILKQYLTGNPEKEYEILKMLYEHGLNVPQPYFFNQKYLIMDYIPGVLLCDLVETADMSWTEKIVEWFIAFHSTMEQEGTSYVKKDVNLRNFVFFNDEFYGIDFEETSVGQPACDIGGLAAHILTNKPRFTQTKQKAVDMIIKSYCKAKGDVTPSDMAKCLWQELLKIAARRPNERQEILKYCFMNQKGWTS
ncbi:MAG TPA: hypothetical protein GXZ27_07785 [Thermoanaerobacterales bacterium]|jgi:tRNA A-37 threonylcarbamoyl transferase component Bud32|nr:hypothetical protein [Thermoanaerobacterales bacterium]